ncbi:MAG: hypothetical protein FJ288_16610 [Planctomycetes bacterium]|nr:hypothetical protein [Planctomycetota bacterium]
MRLCVRLAVLAAMLVALGIGLIYLRTDTSQAGHRLHILYAQKRSLEKTCCRLELAVAGLKNQERLRQEATDILADDAVEPPPPNGRPNGAAADRAFLVNRGKSASP